MEFEPNRLDMIDLRIGKNRSENRSKTCRFWVFFSPMGAAQGMILVENTRTSEWGIIDSTYSL